VTLTVAYTGCARLRLPLLCGAPARIAPSSTPLSFFFFCIRLVNVPAKDKKTFGDLIMQRSAAHKRSRVARLVLAVALYVQGTAAFSAPAVPVPIARGPLQRCPSPSSSRPLRSGLTRRRAELASAAVVAAASAPAPLLALSPLVAAAIYLAGVSVAVCLSPLSMSRALALSLSITHAHTLTLSLSLSHSRSLSLSLSLSLSPSLPPSLSPSLPLPLPLPLPLARSFARSLSRSHLLTRALSPGSLWLAPR